MKTKQIVKLALAILWISNLLFRQRTYAWINEDGDLEVEYEYLAYPNNPSADSCRWVIDEPLVKDYFLGKRIQ
jgi:hypothetical protein